MARLELCDALRMCDHVLQNTFMNVVVRSKLLHLHSILTTLVCCYCIFTLQAGVRSWCLQDSGRIWRVFAM